MAALMAMAAMGSVKIAVAVAAVAWEALMPLVEPLVEPLVVPL